MIRPLGTSGNDDQDHQAPQEETADTNGFLCWPWWISSPSSLGWRGILPSCFLVDLDWSCAPGLENLPARAFFGARVLEKVVLPSTLQRIGPRAFGRCPRLTVVDFSFAVGLKSIGEAAFEECGQLAMIDWSLMVQLDRLPERAFQGCGQLQQVRLPPNLTVIGEAAFSDCLRLKDACLSEAAFLEEIGVGAFQGCKSLERLTLPPLLGVIRASAFRDCTELRTIDGSRAAVLRTMEPSVFEGCEGLTCVDLSCAIQLESIPEQAFQGSKSLKQVLLPPNLKAIENFAFQECEKLQHIDISGQESLAVIGSWAFQECQSLKEVIFPSKLRIIQNCAFARCKQLERIDFSGASSLKDIRGCAFFGCGQLRSVDLSEAKQLATIGSSAFFASALVREVKLPPSLEVIERCAFAFCAQLQDLEFLGHAGARNDLRTVERYSFLECAILERITLPSTLDSFPLQDIFLRGHNLLTTLKTLDMTGDCVKFAMRLSTTYPAFTAETITVNRMLLLFPKKRILRPDTPDSQQQLEEIKILYFVSMIMAISYDESFSRVAKEDSLVDFLSNQVQSGLFQQVMDFLMVPSSISRTKTRHWVDSISKV